MRHRSLILAAGLLAAGLVAGACGGSTSESESAAEAGSFGLTGTADLVGGSQLDWADLRGQDVVLWFWAPW